MRRAVLAAIIGTTVVLTVLMGGWVVEAQQGYTCTINDSFAPVTPPVVVLPIVNRIHCYLNLLRTRALATPRGEVLCRPVSVAAGLRIAVDLTAATPFVGNETASVVVKNQGGNPARLVADSPTLSGATVTAWVWNHDADGGQQGTLCAHVARP